MATRAATARAPAHQSVAAWKAAVSGTGSAYSVPDNPTIIGSAATASMLAARAAVLLIPLATPAWLSATAPSTVAVSGATSMARPRPNRVTPGRTVVRYS